MYASEFGQDKWIIEDVFNGLRGGYFVDIGAFDGQSFSNTYILEKEYEWTGICVEPNSNFYSSLVTRRRCICEKFCIASENTIVDFVSDKIDSSGIIADFSDKTLLAPSLDSHKVEKKVAISLETLLHIHKAPKLIHYLSLDTEGSEYEILKNFNFEKYRILAITVEHNAHMGASNQLKRDNIRSLLIMNDYVYITSNAVEDYYLHKSYI